MRTTLSIIGALLIIFGTILMYKGYTYTAEEKMIQIGNLQLVSEQQKTIISPFIGGASLAVGIILIFLGNIKKK